MAAPGLRSVAMTLGELSSTLVSELLSALRLAGNSELVDLDPTLPIIRRYCTDVFGAASTRWMQHLKISLNVARG